MVVAIDGPAGVGKSSLAQRIAQNHGFFNLNSGAFYRAIALKILDAGLQHAPEKDHIHLAEEAGLDIIEGKLHMDGLEVESRLRSNLVDHWSSVISTIIPIRHAINRNLHRIAKGLSLVAEGRDMTTVVFPHAEIKIFLTAEPHVRASRRFAQGLTEQSFTEIEQNIKKRDQRDLNKEEGAMLIAEDAIILDTSSLTLDEVYEKVSTLIKNYV